MSEESPFPAAAPPSLLEEDVITYLLEWRARGFEVVRETRASHPCYSVIISTLGRITLRQGVAAREKPREVAHVAVGA
ncbi:MAG: hypothetical protein QME96_05280 [Myxococcota bacterium]|nr:hypothetical protein [Myxococcota bacterium]